MSGTATGKPRATRRTPPRASPSARTLPGESRGTASKASPRASATARTRPGESRIVQPDGWPRPKGYSNGVAATGEILFIAGQIGWDTGEKLVSDEFVPQFEKALENVAAVLGAAGGGPEHLARVTIYVTDKTVYRTHARKVGDAWRRILGKTFPAMSLVQVADLLEDGALVEIEATAVLPAR